MPNGFKSINKLCTEDLTELFYFLSCMITVLGEPSYLVFRGPSLPGNEVGAKLSGFCFFTSQRRLLATSCLEPRSRTPLSVRNSDHWVREWFETGPCRVNISNPPPPASSLSTVIFLKKIDKNALWLCFCLRYGKRLRQHNIVYMYKNTVEHIPWCSQKYFKFSWTG